ncbi:hypothetical protein EV424DRAFT_1314258, partial [Suillus variegatus]
DLLDYITSIFNYPLFHNYLDLISHKVYTTAQKLSWVYTEWMTCKHAWNMQVYIMSLLKLLPHLLPCGVTLLGIILFSDKTCITILTGNHIAYLLLISLANIYMNI